MPRLPFPNAAIWKSLLCASILILATTWSLGAAGTGSGSLPGKDAIPAEKRLEEARFRQAMQEHERAGEASARKAYELLRVDGEPEDCAVFRKGDYRCLLDVGTFNDRAKNVERLGDSSVSKEVIRRKRRELVDPLVERAYLEQVRENSGMGREVVRQSRKSMQENSGNLGNMFGDSLLFSLYQSHGGFFRGGWRLHLEVVASSDSAFLDSLHAVWLKAGSGADTLANRRSGVRPFAITLSQTGGRPVEPAGFGELFALAAEAPINAWIRLPGKPFGHLIIRIRKKEEIPTTEFQEARPLLVNLAYLPQVPPQPDASMESAVKAYYAANGDYFRMPDTLLLKVWLRPAISQRDSSGARVASKAFDTSRAPRILTQFGLPPFIRSVLYQNMRCCAGDFRGGLNMPYGIWSFRLLEVRNGTGYRPYGAVRDSLHREFRARQDPIDMAVKYMNDKALSAEMAVWLEKAMEKSMDKSMEKPGQTDADSGTPHNRYREHVRKWADETLDFTRLAE